MKFCDDNLEFNMATERKVTQGIWENPELQPYILPHLVPTDERLGEKDGSFGFAKKVGGWHTMPAGNN